MSPRILATAIALLVGSAIAPAAVALELSTPPDAPPLRHLLENALALKTEPTACVPFPCSVPKVGICICCTGSDVVDCRKPVVLPANAQVQPGPARPKVLAREPMSRETLRRP